MKKQLLLAAFAVLGVAQVNAQNNPLLDNLSLELGYGYNMGVAPKTDVVLSDVNGFRSIHAGATYHINNVWGVRGSYGYNKFEDKKNKDNSLITHKLMLEATFEVLEAVQGSTFSLQEKKFDVTTHAGLGLAIGDSSWPKYTQKDMMGVTQIGLKPTYFVTPQFRVFVDGTYIFNFSQDFRFDGGNGLISEKGRFVGNVMSINLGIQYKLSK